MTIPLSAPDIDEEDIAAVASVMRSGRLSLGPVADAFEAEFAGYVGAPFAVSVSSGTAGLHLALLSLGIGAGDEVIVPSFTFIAAANAIRYVGASPVFVDIDPYSLNMDPARVEEAITERTRGLMVVHTFGVPAAMDVLLSLAQRHELKVIEDACEAIGAEYLGRRVGAIGDAGVFGFYPNKQMTTGEGGMLVTNSQAVAVKARALRNQGRTSGNWFEHHLLGYNYRLSELNAALGLSQLRRIEEMLALRSQVADWYAQALTGCEDFTLPMALTSGVRISWFVYVVRLSERFDRYERDCILGAMTREGIACGRYFAPIHRQQAYATENMLPITDFVADRAIALPFFNRLTQEQVYYVTECLKRATADLRSRA